MQQYDGSVSLWEMAFHQPNVTLMVQLFAHLKTFFVCLYIEVIVSWALTIICHYAFTDVNYPDPDFKQDFFDPLDSFDHPAGFDLARWPWQYRLLKTTIESDMFDAFHHIQSWYIPDIQEIQ